MVEGEIKNWQNENARGSFIIVQKLIRLTAKTPAAAATEEAEEADQEKPQ
jgi:hypothetical protein